LAGFGSGGGMRGLTMCVAAVLANAIGIEAKSPKCVSGSEAGLAADSPCRRHCQISKFVLIWAFLTRLVEVISYFQRIKIENCIESRRLLET
jgi:hypothetical protein